MGNNSKGNLDAERRLGGDEERTVCSCARNCATDAVCVASYKLCLSTLFKFKREAAGDGVEILILGQQGIAVLQAQLSNQAIDSRTNGETLGPADPIDMGGFLVILTTVVRGCLKCL